MADRNHGVWEGEPIDGMRSVMSCGALIMRRTYPESTELEFLLLRTRNRFDLPKGHREGDETAEETALREIYEETGFEAGDLTLQEGFMWTTTYTPRYRRFGNVKVHKTVNYFLATLHDDVNRKPKLSAREHSKFSWVEWSPPHEIQTKTVDPLLSAVAEFLDDNVLDFGDAS